MRRTVVIAIALAAAALIALVAAGCGGTSGSSSNKIALVAYSTPKEAYAALIPAFQKTAQGKGVTFSQSYGASGDQSRAVDGGLPADVVAFSLEPDVTRLVKSGLVADDWNAGPQHGFVTDSVVVLAVRKGNPKQIHDWKDLTKPGVQVLTANPFTSGGARWNVMAAYGANSNGGKDQAAGLAYLKALFKNVPVQDKSARDSLQTFAGGKGDVLIAYENEAITAQQKGIKLDYVIPPQTILIQNPIAVTKDSQSKAKAQAFVGYLHSKPAQEIFASKGYRPIDPKLVDKKRFPTPSGLFTIDQFGGWKVVSDKFFDPDKGLVANVEKELGVSTSSG